MYTKNIPQYLRWYDIWVLICNFITILHPVWFAYLLQAVYNGKIRIACCFARTVSSWYTACNKYGKVFFLPLSYFACYYKILKRRNFEFIFIYKLSKSQLNFLGLLVLCVWLFVHTNIYAPYACLVPTEVK